MKKYQELLDHLHEVRHRHYSNDPDLREAMAEAVEVTLFELLQKLAAVENTPPFDAREYSARAI
jgi:hypothetical protein